jgi:hypothetical protein
VNAWVCPVVALLAVVANIIEVRAFRQLKVGGISKVYYITIALLDLLEAVSRHLLYFCFGRGHGPELGKWRTNYGAMYDYVTRILYGC